MLRSVPAPPKAAGHKSLSVPPVVQPWPYILQRGAARAQSHAPKLVPHRHTDIHEIPLWYFQRHFWEVFFRALLLCIAVFMLPQVDKQPTLSSHGQIQAVNCFPRGQCPHTHTHTDASAHAHTVNPESQHYFLLSDLDSHT